MSNQETIRLAFEYLTRQNVLRCEAPKRSNIRVERNDDYPGLDAWDRKPATPVGFGHPLSSWSELEWAGAMCGEAGEAANIAKKLTRFRDNVAGNKRSYDEYREDLARELGDVIIYAVLLAARCNLDLGAGVIAAFNEKSEEIGSEVKL